MVRGRHEADGPKNIEKFCAVCDLYKRGLLTQEEAARVFEVSKYIWNKWVSRYGNITLNQQNQ